MKDNNSEENYIKELKELNNKLSSMSGYIIAMRSENIQESKKNSETLATLMKYSYDIRGGLWVCLITIWFIAVIFFQKTF